MQRDVEDREFILVLARSDGLAHVEAHFVRGSLAIDRLAEEDLNVEEAIDRRVPVLFRLDEITHHNPVCVGH